MKRILVTAMALLLLALLVLPTVSCGERVPDGTYSCVAADTGEQYIFSGSKVRVVLYIMGNTAIDYSGTYRLKGDRITFSFPEDSDAIYSGTFYYEAAEDGSSITIGTDVFIKE